MEVITCLREEDVEKNMVFVSPEDARAAYVTIGKFVYRCYPDADIEKGHIVMNSFQRRAANVFPAERVIVHDFLVPMRDFSLVAMTVEAEWLRNPGNIPRPDLSQLASVFRTKFAGHVMTRDQCVVMQYIDALVHFRVKTQQGLLTFYTEVGIEWNDSYV